MLNRIASLLVQDVFVIFLFKKFLMKFPNPNPIPFKNNMIHPFFETMEALVL